LIKNIAYIGRKRGCQKKKTFEKGPSSARTETMRVGPDKNKPSHHGQLKTSIKKEKGHREKVLGLSPFQDYLESAVRVIQGVDAPETDANRNTSLGLTPSAEVRLRRLSSPICRSIDEGADKTESCGKATSYLPRIFITLKAKPGGRGRER